MGLDLELIGLKKESPEKSLRRFQLGECFKEWGLSHRRLCRRGFEV